jgi:transposase
MNNVSQKQEKIYFGLDISQKTIEIFALKGEKGVSFGKIPNNQESLTEFFAQIPAKPETITVVLETGTHSAWINRLLESCGYDVIVAHARDLAFIYKGDKKSDRIDAEKLARMARADKKLLHPIKVIDKKRQEDLLAIKARDLLVKQRTGIVNAIRGFLRSMGIDDSIYSHEVINDIYSELPKEIQENLRGLFSTLTAIDNNIKEYDKRIRKIAKDYPNCEFVSAQGLGGNTDNLHFSASSLEEFGRRYYDAFTKLDVSETLNAQSVTDTDTARTALEKL